MKGSSLTDSCILSCKNGNIYSAQQQYIEHKPPMLCVRL